MDTFVENSGVTEEKHIHVTPLQTEKQKQVPIENAGEASAPLDEEGSASESESQTEHFLNAVRAEKPDPLGRRTFKSPLNEIKAGYDYAFRKNTAKR